MDQASAKKIKSADALVKIVAKLKKEGKKVVQCHGVFDLLHLGHIRHFNTAKKEGDVLLVTLTRDKYVKRGPGRPIFNEQLRAETLASLSTTDYVSIIDAPTATAFIRKVKPNVYVKGLDYKDKKKDVTGMIFEEEAAIKSIGGRLAFTDDITFSSSKLINTELDVYPPETLRYLRAIPQRHPIDSVIEKLGALKNLKTLVIGDAIVDEYHYVTTLGKSSKDHLVVNKYESDEMFAGGALATANNAASVCGQVDLLTVLGAKDSHQEFIEKKLAPNVKPLFFYRKDAGTIVKRRFVNEGNRKLFEICYMKIEDIPPSLEADIIRRVDKIIKDYDLVIAADFGHGLLTRKIIQRVCAKAKYLAVNAQTNGANHGFNLVTKYPRSNLICIDQMELRFAAHDKSSDLQTLAKKVYEDTGCDQIIATRGPLGSLSYSENCGFHESPAFAYRVVDSIGAGDAFFAFVAPCFAAGMPQDLVSFIGNAVGSLAVQIVCNREPVRLVDLSKFITRLLK